MLSKTSLFSFTLSAIVLMGNSQPGTIFRADSMSVVFIRRALFFDTDLTCVPRFQDVKQDLLHVMEVTARDLENGVFKDVVVVSHRHRRVTSHCLF